MKAFIAILALMVGVSASAETKYLELMTCYVSKDVGKIFFSDMVRTTNVTDTKVVHRVLQLLQVDNTADATLAPNYALRVNYKNKAGKNIWWTTPLKRLGIQKTPNGLVVGYSAFQDYGVQSFILNASNEGSYITPIKEGVSWASNTWTKTYSLTCKMDHPPVSPQPIDIASMSDDNAYKTLTDLDHYWYSYYDSSNEKPPGLSAAELKKMEEALIPLLSAEGADDEGQLSLFGPECPSVNWGETHQIVDMAKNTIGYRISARCSKEYKVEESEWNDRYYYRQATKLYYVPGKPGVFTKSLKDAEIENRTEYVRN
jgi:hypothetical protein